SQRRRRLPSSPLAVVPGCPAGEVGQLGIPLRELPALGVDEPPVEARAEQRLRLDHDRAQLPVLESALLLDGREQVLVAEMPFAEVPAEDRASDVLAVDVLVLLERTTVDRAREEESEAAPLEVERAEGHAARVHARGLRRREALELLAKERRGALQAVELAVAVAAEEPRVPRPVAGVVAHRHQEGDPRRDGIAEER